MFRSFWSCAFHSDYFNEFTEADRTATVESVALDPTVESVALDPMES